MNICSVQQCIVHVSSMMLMPHLIACTCGMMSANLSGLLVIFHKICEINVTFWQCFNVRYSHFISAAKRGSLSSISGRIIETIICYIYYHEQLCNVCMQFDISVWYITMTRQLTFLCFLYHMFPINVTTSICIIPYVPNKREDVYLYHIIFSKYTRTHISFSYHTICSQ